MILVIEAGGTKTDARAWNNGKTETLSGPGINPYFLSDAEIKERLIHFSKADWKTEERSYLYYYGAGCQKENQKIRIRNHLEAFFPNFHIEVEHDLLAAARALCGNKPGFAGILGTGSNGCYFNGQTIEKQMVSLGFWLGDEGSGGYLGKLLIKEWLRGKIPLNLEKSFLQMVPWEKENALATIYSDPNINANMAGLARFCFENRDHVWIENLISENLTSYFFQISDLLEGLSGIPMHFTGSVAFRLKDDLSRHIKRMGQNPGMVIANPSDALLQFHLEGSN